MESNQMTKRDLNKLALRSVLLQSSFNYERMQAAGWLNAIAPSLKKVHADDEQRLKESMEMHLDFMNTQPVMSSFLMGLVVSLEEKKEPVETIRALKTGLFGPLAGIGDAIFWFTILPIVIGITSSLAIDGNIVGPIIFFIAYLGIFFLRIPFTRAGYTLGVSALDKIQIYSKDFAEAATILGITVSGGLIALYVNFKVAVELSIPGSDQVVNIQEQFFDAIMPAILPLAITFTMYYFIKYKNTKPIYLIFGTIGICLILSLVGIA